MGTPLLGTVMSAKEKETARGGRYVVYQIKVDPNSGLQQSVWSATAGSIAEESVASRLYYGDRVSFYWEVMGAFVDPTAPLYLAKQIYAVSQVHESCMVKETNDIYTTLITPYGEDLRVLNATLLKLGDYDPRRQYFRALTVCKDQLLKYNRQHSYVVQIQLA